MVGTKHSCNSGIICSKIICIKPNPVTLEVLPFFTYTLAPVVLSLLEAPLEVLFWYTCETCCHVLFTCFYECEVMTFQPTLKCWKEPDVAQRKIWKMWWLGMVGVWIFTKTVALRLGCNKDHLTLQNFHMKVELTVVCPTGRNSRCTRTVISMQLC